MANRKKRQTGVSPNSLLKIFAGYNSHRWAITAMYLGNNLRLLSTDDDQRVVLLNGSYRLHFVYRFKPGKRAKRLLKPVDRIEKEVEKLKGNG